MPQDRPLPRALRAFEPYEFGRYSLLTPIAAGGMGEVYLGRTGGAEGFEKFVVIKKIVPALAREPDFVARFIDEAKIVVKLHHGAIAQVLDMGIIDGEYYLAMEFVDGKDLRKILQRCRERGERLAHGLTLFIVVRVLDALAYAHRKKGDDGKALSVVHRDISPQNVLVSYEGEVKVIDFGLAKSTLSLGRTNPSMILGKFFYMSPEQARHQPVDRRSDLYSVGIVLWEALAGKNPFDSISPAEIMFRAADPQIPPLIQVEPTVPPPIAAAIDRALAVDPSVRFGSAEEMRNRLMTAMLETDPHVGPESLASFMGLYFAREYHAERRLMGLLAKKAVPSSGEVTGRTDLHEGETQIAAMPAPGEDAPPRSRPRDDATDRRPVPSLPVPDSVPTPPHYPVPDETADFVLAQTSVRKLTPAPAVAADPASGGAPRGPTPVGPDGDAPLTASLRAALAEEMSPDAGPLPLPTAIVKGPRRPEQSPLPDRADTSPLGPNEFGPIRARPPRPVEPPVLARPFQAETDRHVLPLAIPTGADPGRPHQGPDLAPSLAVRRHPPWVWAATLVAVAVVGLGGAYLVASALLAPTTALEATAPSGAARGSPTSRPPSPLGPSELAPRAPPAQPMTAAAAPAGPSVPAVEHRFSPTSPPGPTEVSLSRTPTPIATAPEPAPPAPDPAVPVVKIPPGPAPSTASVREPTEVGPKGAPPEGGLPATRAEGPKPTAPRERDVRRAERTSPPRESPHTEREQAERRKLQALKRDIDELCRRYRDRKGLVCEAMKPEVDLEYVKKIDNPAAYPELFGQLKKLKSDLER